MAEEYVNRKDERYFLYQGKTPSGKPKYFCSRKPSASGTPVEAMPPGYEWRENPENGIVSVRKVRVSRIASFERDMLSEAIRGQAGLKTFIVDVSEDSLVAYIPDRNPDQVAHIFDMLGLRAEQMASMGEWTAKHANYSPMMRFVLHNEDVRSFIVERWCFRGSIDRWIFLNGPAPLRKLIDEYARHLGDESFFELM